MRLSPMLGSLGRSPAGLVAVMALGALLLAYFASPATAQASIFALISEPIGVAYAPGHVLVTSPFCGDPRRVYEVDHQGNVSIFATLPPRGGGCFEEYIAVSPGGLPHWPANRAYVTQGSNVVEIDPNGNVSPFTTVACGPSHNGITFDEIGLFGYQMIVTCASGQVQTVDQNGISTLVATVPDFIENPDVAPLSFAPHGGHVFVASEGTGNVWAVSPGGVVTLVANWPGAEGVDFIPTNVCEFDGSNGAYFRAIFPTHIRTSPDSNFAAFGGKAIVTSETGAGLGLMTAPGVVVPFGQDAGIQHEGSTFVDFSRGCRFNRP